MRIKWFSIIRLTGLFLVLFYHFFQTKFPGGFIGVDLFFTFSGFLVTSLFIDEYARTKTIDLFNFVRRRLYRIMPPLVLMVLLVMPLTFLVKKDFVADIGHQIAATLGFTTNIYELMTGGNYESQFIPHLFLHTWSLSIEVQFYVFWGIVIYFLSRQGWSTARFKGTIFLLSAGLFALTYLTLFIRSIGILDFSSLYFSSIARSFSFFMGSVFATTIGIQETTRRFRTNARLWSTGRVIFQMVGCIAMLVLLAFLLEFNHMVTYMFGFILASFFTSLLIYSTRVLHEKTPNLPEPIWLIYLADISYGIYLFHWPLYIIFSQSLPNLLAVAVTMVLSVALASLSYSVIEPLVAGKTPFLFGLSISLPEKKWPIYAILGVLVSLTLGISATAPRIGDFETQLLVSSLVQADSNMNRTHTLAAGDAQALSDVMIIGDSVTLRASESITSLLPTAELDAAVSRSFELAYEIFQNEVDLGTLPQTVVIAVGVNSVYNYQSDIDLFINNLPDGHRLVLVTPYNIKDGRVPAVRDYELALAEQYEFIAIADWYKVATENPEIWAGTDGVHFSDANTLGSELYAKTIQKAIAKVAKQPAKGGVDLIEEQATSSEDSQE